MVSVPARSLLVLREKVLKPVGFEEEGRHGLVSVLDKHAGDQAGPVKVAEHSIYGRTVCL